MQINRENLTKLSIDYMKVLAALSKAKQEGCHPNMYLQILFHHSRLKEIAKEIEEILEKNEKNSQVLE